MKKRQRDHVERKDNVWDIEQGRVADLLTLSEERLRRIMDRLNGENVTVLRRSGKGGRRRSPPT